MYVYTSSMPTKMYAVTKTQSAMQTGAIVPAKTNGKPNSQSCRQRTMCRAMVGGTGDENMRSHLQATIPEGEGGIAGSGLPDIYICTYTHIYISGQPSAPKTKICARTCKQ